MVLNYKDSGVNIDAGNEVVRQIKDVVKKSRVLHAKSRTFWALMLKMKIDLKSYEKAFWPY